MLALASLAAIGFGAYTASAHLRAWQHLRKAERELERLHFAEARTHLAACLEVWPGNSDVTLQAARAARRDGAFDEAEKLLARYRALHGVPEAIELEQRLMAAQRGQLAGLEGPLWECALRDPEDAALILEAMIRGYLKSGQWPQALPCLKRLLELQPDNPLALLWDGVVWESLINLPLAEASYRRAVEVDPENQEARIRLALVLNQLSRPAEAAEYFEKLRQLKPDNAAVLLGLARSRAALNQTGEAITILDQMLAAKRDTADVLAERGKLAIAQGDLVRAENWLRQSLKLAPNEREPNYYLALCLRKQPGKETEAEAASARLKQIEQDQHRLQELLAESVKKPRDPDLRSEIGGLLLKNGQIEDGLRWLQGVLQDEPEHRPTHQVLAEYYQGIGDRERALQHRGREQGR